MSSTTTLPWKPRPRVGADPLAGCKPRYFRVNGERREFFTLGDLAKALNRQSVTIRKWERRGIIPKPTYRFKGRNGDIRGSRRLYTREEIIGLVRIAQEEGVYYPHERHIADTAFRVRAHRLFAELRAQAKAAMRAAS